MTEISLRGGFDVGPYKGYHGRAEYDSDTGEYHGRITETRDVITFVGSDPAELTKAFVDSINDYLEFCESKGRDPEKPYSGNFLIRTTPQRHKALKVAADKANKSLTQFVLEAAENAVAYSTAGESLTIAAQRALLAGPSGSLWYEGNPLSTDPATNFIALYAAISNPPLELEYGGRLMKAQGRVTVALQSPWELED
ncbi:MAG: type II toxin-antitoxin system HicB family antitoxin [Pirellulales bacterium]